MSPGTGGREGPRGGHHSRGETGPRGRRVPGTSTRRTTTPRTGTRGTTPTGPGRETSTRGRTPQDPVPREGTGRHPRTRVKEEGPTEGTPGGGTRGRMEDGTTDPGRDETQGPRGPRDYPKDEDGDPDYPRRTSLRGRTDPGRASKDQDEETKYPGRDTPPGGRVPGVPGPGPSPQSPREDGDPGTQDGTCIQGPVSRRRPSTRRASPGTRPRDPR